MNDLLIKNATLPDGRTGIDVLVSDGRIADVAQNIAAAAAQTLDARAKVKPYLDLQLVAFPQDGLLRSPGALAQLERALAMGVDVVGGIPHFERTQGEGAESVRILCELAAAKGCLVDMHCDETD